MDLPLLYQFRVSHFAEKARWALDYKKVPHRRRTLLAGFHMPIMLLSTGHRQVPVLRADGQVFAGSTSIIQVLEAKYPDPPLLPESEQGRARAAELVSWLDDEVGPHIRRAVYHEILYDTPWTSRLFSAELSAGWQSAYAMTFPFVRFGMRKMMKIDAAGAKRSDARIAAALDRLDGLIGPSGYLVGDRFSIADLTAAALLYPIPDPPEYPYPLLPRRPPELDVWRARYAQHPVSDWVARIYREHRGVSAEVGLLQHQIQAGGA